MVQAARAGYIVSLVFLTAHTEEDTRLRIENRVLEGGHNIPDADLERRAPRILENLPGPWKGLTSPLFISPA